MNHPLVVWIHPSILDFPLHSPYDLYTTTPNTFFFVFALSPGGEDESVAKHHQVMLHSHSIGNAIHRQERESVSL